MRLIYIDEAGTSAHEPISLVAAVILNADLHWRKADSELSRLFDAYVPRDLREGYVFHSKDVFGGGAHRELWDEGARMQLMKGVASIPRRLGLVLTIGSTRRDAPAEDVGSLRPEQFHHVMAFLMCLAHADAFARVICHGEVAVAVAEDCPPMRTALGKMLSLLRDNPIHLDPTLVDENSSPGPKSLASESLIDRIHFAGKADAPLLQIADACAFAMRRYLCGQSKGRELMESALGSEIFPASAWTGPAAARTFRWED
jgi:hypothetical protein